MHAFVVAPGTRQERMAAAVTDVGASVLSGITLTKFVGMHSACTGVPDICWIRITDIIRGCGMRLRMLSPAA